jgi:hypothetical protein
MLSEVEHSEMRFMCCGAFRLIATWSNATTTRDEQAPI